MTQIWWWWVLVDDDIQQEKYAVDWEVYLSLLLYQTTSIYSIPYKLIMAGRDFKL